MKTKLFSNVAMLMVALTFSLQNTNAQSWLLGGNNTAKDTALGTINLHSVRIISNDTERIHVDKGGNIGINTSNPTHAKLQINGSVGAAVAMFGADKFGVTIEANNPEVGFNYFFNGKNKTIQPGYASVVGMTPSSGDVYISNFSGAQSTTPFGNITPSAYRQVFTVKQNGKVGIGTTIPQQRLSVDSGMNIDQANVNNGAINSGLTFGSNSGEGIASKRTTGGNQFGLDFYTSFSKRMSITQAGNVGIGTGNNNPSSTLDVLGGIWDLTTTEGDLRVGNSAFRMKIGVATDGGGAGDVRIRAVGGTNRLLLGGSTSDVLTVTGSGMVGIGTITPQWPLEVGTDSAITAISSFTSYIDGNGSVAQCNNGASAYGIYGISSSGFAGYFEGNVHSTGVITQASDQKLKENIKPIDETLDKILLLKPSSFNFKNEYKRMNLPQGEQTGFIAQDMEKVFPQLVKTVYDKQQDSGKIFEYKAVNYIGLIPLLTKAIQDQQEEIDQLKEQISQLSAVIAGTANNAMSSKIADLNNTATLYQNIPNPFDNSSSISYYIPSGYHNAQLMITDASGKTLKTYSITQSGAGKQVISGSELTGGMYQYSLLVDGKLVDSKKMVLSK
jgi:hypothetical protein